MIEYLRERNILLPAVVIGIERLGGARACAQARLQEPRRGPVAGDDRRTGSAADRSRRKRTHAVRLAARMAGSAAPEKSLSGSSNGSKPCASSASEPIARSAFTARATRRSREKSPSSFRATSRASTRRAVWRPWSCSRARWRPFSPTPRSPCSTRCSALSSGAPIAPTRTTWSTAPRRSTRRRAPCSAWPRPCSPPRQEDEDQVAAVERALGWERLKTLVAETEAVVADTRPDNLGEVVERYASVRRMSPVVLGAFAFRSWKENDPLLAALDVVRELHASGAKKLPAASADGFPAANMAQGRQDRRRNRSPGL